MMTDSPQLRQLHVPAGGLGLAEAIGAVALTYDRKHLIAMSAAAEGSLGGGSIYAVAPGGTLSRKAHSQSVARGFLIPSDIGGIEENNATTTTSTSICVSGPSGETLTATPSGLALFDASGRQLLERLPLPPDVSAPVTSLTIGSGDQARWGASLQRDLLTHLNPLASLRGPLTVH